MINKKFLTTLSIAAVASIILGTNVNAAEVNEIAKADPIKVDITLNTDQLDMYSKLRSVDGRVVNRTAYMPYEGTVTSDGTRYKYSLIIEIPYSTYEDMMGKSIYSVDDNGITSYLNKNFSVTKYKQSYAYSSISSNKGSATIKGFGQATFQLSVNGIGYTSQNDIDFKVNITPGSGN
ncbi:hypothetical protein DVV81_11540 [Clostridium botulinum]|uniref:hypothetical protein n=1 Tax=Clostridium botulinum TaxID=1491 RepID=UPI001966D21F|nr:hypothetical protein [Clostridium botulinum]MBN1059222.1 hypothetical protein [Clostridium botulinum]MBN1062423.1 hypothetical protein [Clostridium botulinum]MBN1071793.1 hypothetical protein [Clostridium botulinum]